MLGESPVPVLGPNLLAVYIHIEHTTGALDEFRLDSACSLDCIRQTGGLRQVVSFTAVLNGDPHSCFPLREIHGHQKFCVCAYLAQSAS